MQFHVLPVTATGALTDQRKKNCYFVVVKHIVRIRQFQILNSCVKLIPATEEKFLNLVKILMSVSCVMVACY